MTNDFQTAFEASASVSRSADEVRALAAAIRGGAEGAALTDLAASFVRAAFAAPETLARTYDAAAEGWFGEPVGGPEIATLDFPFAPVPDTLWADLWPLALQASGGMDALEITGRTAALAGHLPPDFVARAGAAAYEYPGLRDAAAGGLPPRFSLDALGACPPGSLGRQFHSQIVDNGFDLEVVDRDALALSSLPAPHDYVNTRMLQTHDLIHLTAGYELTSLHEIGISAFQLSQCGHGYSASFLALVATTAAMSGQASAMGFMMDTVLAAWVHGRRTPSMLAIPWEAVWDQPIEAIRARFGITPFASPYPADIIEQLTRAAA